MPLALRDRIKATLGERVLGSLDYVRGQLPPTAHHYSWALQPFNGQTGRAALFRQTTEQLNPVAIVETGTYLGSTTRYMAGTGLPVYTVEADPRISGYARARLALKRNVYVHCGDSRVVLQNFLHRLRSKHGAEVPLFLYLDAHWYADLPLAEELNLAFTCCPRAVAMVDDFQVPFDPGYQYDNYGPDKALTPDYIAELVAKFGLVALYPTLESTYETGAKRGCVVLVKATYAERIDKIPALRRA